MIGVLILVGLFVFGVMLWVHGAAIEYKQRRAEAIHELVTHAYEVLIRLRMVGVEDEFCKQFWRRVVKVAKKG